MAINGFPLCTYLMLVIMAVKECPVSVMYLSHVSNNGHQGVASFRIVPISCE